MRDNNVDELMRRERPLLHDRLINWGRVYRDHRPQGTCTTGIICQRLMKANLVMDARPLGPGLDHHDAHQVQRAWVSMRSPFGITRHQAALAAYYVQGRAPVRAVMQEIMAVPGPSVTAGTFHQFILVAACMLDKHLFRIDTRGTT